MTPAFAAPSNQPPALRGCSSRTQVPLTDAPVTTLVGTHHAEQVQAWFATGSDEVLTGLFTPAEQRARLDSMLVRTERDVSVHPSTRLPGTNEIEREIRRRLESDQEFAV